MVVAINPIHQAAGLKRVVVSTYQAVSGAGQAAMDECLQQTRDYLAGRELVIQKFPYRIAFNLIPHIDVFLENNYTKEEMKMVYETRKIMHLPNLKVSATCVRVPVLRAHSESINLQTEKKLSREDALKILAKSPGIQVKDDPSKLMYPMPIDATQNYATWVGRVREDISQENGLDIFVVADQLLKGAAWNAVQIAEYLV
jgi:aspartate-semialdehyde dehydrogenase